MHLSGLSAASSTVTATRAAPFSNDIDHPVSPRGSLALAAAAKARAYLHGRDYALPEDVADVAPDALAHRIVMTWRAVAEGRTTPAQAARDMVTRHLGG